MCFYVPELTQTDIEFLLGQTLPGRAEGRNTAACYVTTEDGNVTLTGIKQSGNDGGDHTRSAYGKKAWSGHRHDAEIKVLSALPANLGQDKRGTMYFLGSGGPCDSCKEAINLFRDAHRKVQVKVLYITAPEWSVLQDEGIQYGWKGDRTLKLRGDDWFYHYIPAKDFPDPPNAKTRQDIEYCKKQLERQAKAIAADKMSLADFQEDPARKFGVKKAAANHIADIMKTYQHRILVAARTWGERIRFGNDDPKNARDNVVRQMQLNVVEAAEFDRCLRHAEQRAFGNMYVPTAEQLRLERL